MRTLACSRLPEGKLKYGCHAMAMGSASLPTLCASIEASTVSAVRVMVMTRSVLENQWPPKLPA